VCAVEFHGVQKNSAKVVLEQDWGFCLVSSLSLLDDWEF